MVPVVIWYVVPGDVFVVYDNVNVPLILLVVILNSVIVKEPAVIVAIGEPATLGKSTWAWESKLVVKLVFSVNG